MPVPNLSRAPRVNASHIIRDISLRRRLHIVNRYREVSWRLEE